MWQSRKPTIQPKQSKVYSLVTWEVKSSRLDSVAQRCHQGPGMTHSSSLPASASSSLMKTKWLQMLQISLLHPALWRERGSLSVHLTSQ